MTRRRVRKNFGNAKRRRGPNRVLRLALEPLEARRLLAGLNVSVFLDHNNSRSFDSGDAVAAGRLVYLDLNRNGVQDTSDPFATTDSDGIAYFADLLPGDYSVALSSGNVNDRQTTPTGPQATGVVLAGPASALLVTRDLTNAWSLDDQGRGERVLGIDSPISHVDFGSGLVTSLQVSGNEFWLITERQAAQRLTHFDIISGQHISQSIMGLNGRSISKLIQAGSQVVAQLEGTAGIQLAPLSLVHGVPTVGAAVQMPGLKALAGSSNSNEIVVVRSSSPAEWTLSKLSATNFDPIATQSLTASVGEVSFSHDGSHVLTAQTAGGIGVYGSEQLTKVAFLAEAMSPVLATSEDGRFVTGSSHSTGELIVWNQSTWLPTGRTTLPASATDFVVSASGDTLLAATSAGVLRTDLAHAAAIEVAVHEGSITETSIGVRTLGINAPPPSPTLAVSLHEDSVAAGELRSEIIDIDGDEVWFSTLSSPENGRLELSADGRWSYHPHPNFFGVDRAWIKAYDGQATSEFSVQFDVVPVDDPPTDILIDLSPIPENATAGTDVGSLAVIDIDSSPSYQFTISDPRFVIEQGRLVVAAGARFDYEAEPTVYLHIVASENSTDGYQITTIADIQILDVAEPPTEIFITSEPIPENDPGAVVGVISLPDSASISDYTFSISDDRFELVDGQLQLKPGIAIDYEASDTIYVAIAITASSGETATSTVTVNVANRNDAPTGIEISLNTVTERTPGQIIGSVVVVDQDQEYYNYTVSDPRFEVVGGMLRLKEGESLSKSTDGSLSLSVSASSAAGATVTQRVVVDVKDKPPAFQNPNEPRDVNGDGKITPLDALLILNHLNRYGPRVILPESKPGAEGESPYMFDVNGDGRVTPIDVLIIINYLNRRARDGSTVPTTTPTAAPETVSPTVEEVNDPPQTTVTSTLEGVNDPPPLVLPEGEAAFATSFGMACPAFEPESDLADADGELESLLEQISRERLRTLN